MQSERAQRDAQRAGTGRNIATQRPVPADRRLKISRPDATGLIKETRDDLYPAPALLAQKQLLLATAAVRGVLAGAARANHRLAVRATTSTNPPLGLAAPSAGQASGLRTPLRTATYEFQLNDEVLVEGSRGQRSLHLNRALILSATAEYWDLGSGPYFEIRAGQFLFLPVECGLRAEPLNCRAVVVRCGHGQSS